MQAEPLHQLPSSPSFSSYVSGTFAHIAARVIREIRNDTRYEENDNPAPPSQNDDDFEFSFSRHPAAFPLVSADDIFRNGRIIPSYPLSHRTSLSSAKTAQNVPQPRRLPLRELMFGEQERVNDLKGLDAGSYCVWNPSPTPPSRSPCKDKKSVSVGSFSSKRWKLRDLLVRSHSVRTNKVAPKHASAGNANALTPPNP